MRPPLLSVCLITYNHKNYIQQAIESVLIQKVNFSWEFIIADDYSTDGTKEIVFKYKEKYPELIRIISREKNIGAAKNWLELLSSANGKYIAYFEGDDYWCDPLKLQKQIDFLEANPDYAICFHEANVLFEDGSKTLYNNIDQDKTFQFLDLTQKNFISTASCVFRLYENSFPLPDWFFKATVGDWGLHLLSALNGNIYYMKDCMSVYRVHNQGYWSSLSLEQMQAKGLEVMDELNAAFDYKYNEYFEKGKAQRIADFNKENLPRLIYKEGFKTKWKRRIKNYLGLQL